jgi:AraC family transcriptional regulator, regulatory protein of adaptative response / methylated-DNA-[protein]-cysteine methyltransferase
MVNRDYMRIERAIQYLALHADQHPALGDVAAHIGLSEYHFQRLFRRWAGVSPKRFLQFLTAEHARALLQSSRSVLDVAMDAGLSGTGRLHDLMLAIHAATPGDIKKRGAGMTIHYGVHASPFGDCLIALTEHGICNLEFLPQRGQTAAMRAFKDTWSAAALREQPRITRPVVARLFDDPRAKQAPVHLLLRGTNFQIKVWEALLRIPSGHVTSYEHLAGAIGMPRATRAVASAVAQNSIAYLIPCHRVIRKTGVFGEYRWGAARKQALLAWEATR